MLLDLVIFARAGLSISHLHNAVFATLTTKLAVMEICRETGINPGNHGDSRWDRCTTLRWLNVA